MKTKSIAIALSLIVLTSATLMASDLTPSLEIKNEKGSSVYKVVYKSAGQGKVSLRISSKDHGTLYTEVLNFTDRFTYPLDFNGMMEGEYTVEITNKTAKLKQSVVYKVKNPLAYVRVSKQLDEKYMLTIASQVPADFTVRIYDRWNREVLAKNESVSGTFGLVYNLANVDGPFTFDVTEAAGTVDIVKH